MKRYKIFVHSIEDRGFTLTYKCFINEDPATINFEDAFILPLEDWKYTSILVPSGKVKFSEDGYIILKMRMDSSMCFGDNTFPKRNDAIAYLITYNKECSCLGDA